MAPNIFLYNDFRKFLIDHFNYKKNKESLNYVQWTKQLNINSPSLLSMILNGSRPPSKAVLEEFIKYLKLNDLEKEYFKSMVKFDIVQDDPILKDLLIQKLEILRRGKI